MSVTETLRQGEVPLPRKLISCRLKFCLKTISRFQLHYQESYRVQTSALRPPFDPNTMALNRPQRQNFQQPPHPMQFAGRIQRPPMPIKVVLTPIRIGFAEDSTQIIDPDILVQDRTKGSTSPKIKDQGIPGTKILIDRLSTHLKSACSMLKAIAKMGTGVNLFTFRGVHRLRHKERRTRRIST